MKTHQPYKVEQFENGLILQWYQNQKSGMYSLYCENYKKDSFEFAITRPTVSEIIKELVDRKIF